jgi:hypothetical protein
MTVSEFVKGFNEVTDKETYVKRHIKTDYVNYVDKANDCERIVKASCYDAEGKFKANTVSQYFLFVQTLVDRYLGLQYKDALNMFDTFERYGITEVFISVIEKEYSKYTTILNMVANDIIADETSLTNYFDAKINGLMNLLSNIEEGELDVSTDEEIN